uniref:Uncharacterized protein n=1 Tax=Candidatus Kentrum sp. MB TaxID=2138164 RepID=A0A450X9W6_9GAMM|nr:MAG: hypothetical protein BECKMB1821G_GA0114241_101831 [Candidatus Kentron sp. MB]VFK35454.1 MAG: hypothetical protein BECKMB1821I_GA0114274_11195 [Candidatus Kentron sp. MB]VFK77398.1 MAG: hypothetical protein BECKMB1821H_GA0114242_11335 [Candidatus Kentron sp. MB]
MRGKYLRNYRYFVCGYAHRAMLIAIDDRKDYGEDRLIGIGLLQTRVVIVVYTEREEKTIRIISRRKALGHERKRYQQILQDGLGTG